MFGFNLFQTSKLKVIPLSPYFYVCTHVNFTRVNKIETIYGIPYEREPRSTFTFMHGLSFIGSILLTRVNYIIPLHEKFLQFDWLRAVVFQLNLKYLHVKITKPLQVVV